MNEERSKEKQIKSKQKQIRYRISVKLICTMSHLLLLLFFLLPFFKFKIRANVSAKTHHANWSICLFIFSFRDISNRLKNLNKCNHSIDSMILGMSYSQMDSAAMVYDNGHFGPGNQMLSVPQKKKENKTRSHGIIHILTREKKPSDCK